MTLTAALIRSDKPIPRMLLATVLFCTQLCLLLSYSQFHIHSFMGEFAVGWEAGKPLLSAWAAGALLVATNAGVGVTRGSLEG